MKAAERVVDVPVGFWLSTAAGEAKLNTVQRTNANK